jgi:hypothetical protein
MTTLDFTPQHGETPIYAALRRDAIIKKQRQKEIDEKYPLLKRWTHPRCYMGAEWEDYFGSGFGRSRDSKTLEESNFDVVQTKLAELPEWVPPDVEEGDEEPISRQVIRESHWAVGWVEWICIHESDAAALELCSRLVERVEGYPSLDDEHWSKLQSEAAESTWKNCYNEKERIKYIREHRRDFEFRSFADLLGCVRGKYFCGDDSDICN